MAATPSWQWPISDKTSRSRSVAPMPSALISRSTGWRPPWGRPRTPPSAAGAAGPGASDRKNRAACSSPTAPSAWPSRLTIASSAASSRGGVTRASAGGGIKPSSDIAESHHASQPGQVARIEVEGRPADVDADLVEPEVNVDPAGVGLDDGVPAAHAEQQYRIAAVGRRLGQALPQGGHDRVGGQPDPFAGLRLRPPGGLRAGAEPAEREEGRITRAGRLGVGCRPGQELAA